MEIYSDRVKWILVLCQFVKVRNTSYSTSLALLKSCVQEETDGNRFHACQAVATVRGEYFFSRFRSIIPWFEFPKHHVARALLFHSIFFFFSNHASRLLLPFSNKSPNSLQHGRDSYVWELS